MNDSEKLAAIRAAAVQILAILDDAAPRPAAATDAVPYEVSGAEIDMVINGLVMQGYSMGLERGAVQEVVSHFRGDIGAAQAAFAAHVHRHRDGEAIAQLKAQNGADYVPSQREINARASYLLWSMSHDQGKCCAASLQGFADVND